MDTDLLTERLHLLADAAPLPATSVADDVRRGRRRLGSRRLAATGGAAAVAVVAAMALGGAVAERAEDAVPPPARPPVADAPAPRTGDESLDLGGLLRQGTGEAIFTLDEIQRFTDAVRARYPERGWRYSAAASTDWAATGAGSCPAGWTCGDLGVRGAAHARWAESGEVRQAAVDFGGNVIVVTLSTEDTPLEDLAWAVR